MVSVLASSVVDCEFEIRSGHTIDYEIGMCCFSVKYAALRGKSNDWLARNQNNVSEWSDMYTRVLLFQWASTDYNNQTQHVGLEQSGPHHCSRWKIAEHIYYHINGVNMENSLP